MQITIQYSEYLKIKSPYCKWNGTWIDVSFFPQEIDISIFESVMKKFFSYQKALKVLCYLFSWLENVKNISHVQSCENAKQKLLQLHGVDEKIITGVRRQFHVQMEENLFFVYPRSILKDGRPYQEKLILINGESLLGKIILSDCHICVSGLGAQIGKII